MLMFTLSVFDPKQKVITSIFLKFRHFFLMKFPPVFDVPDEVFPNKVISNCIFK